MTLLALVAIIFFGFATYNLTCAFVDIPTKKTSRMMMLARKQQGVKAEKLLDVYITKIAGLIAPYLKLDKLKRNKLQRALDIAGLELTPEIYTARAWGHSRRCRPLLYPDGVSGAADGSRADWACGCAVVLNLLQRLRFCQEAPQAH